MRRPIEQEIRGLQTPRERIWAAIRGLKKGFTHMSVQDACNPLVPLTCVEDYFKDLEKARYIKRTAAGRVTRGSQRVADEYELVKDQFEAPRLSDGKPVTQGLGVLAMWRAIKVLQKGFDYQDVAKAASQGSFQVKPQAAKTYVNLLARAGYFRVLQAAKPGTPARYALVRNTGPHAPAITRRKCVFDRNTGEFAELETAQEVCDALPE